MNTVSYIERKTYVRYDADSYLLYLNEAPADVVVDEESGETARGYSYTGEETDGSTRISVDARTVTVGYTFERDTIRYLFLFIRQVHGIQSFQNQKSCIYGFTWVAIESFGGSSCIGVQSVEKAVRVCNQLAVCGGNISCRTNGEQCYTLSSVSHTDICDSKMRLRSIVYYIEACHGASE